ncbi:polysaccharide pyruvyl transferase family protein [Pseudorhodoferax sp. Leaf265]|uniref:polysaccharide pyruvyl transferase family protein n=1 Tax=Pseudorhodoferax sp. Leaf265 TaxID=1736315 RepID=UPI0006F7DE6B|nr:polysaccharide pyruvyl transferase family protein [Pseudorhodoferax sp. Leaf265]KQP21184.1 pyruvyl transferase [Pseudorhodoferax sp. Leaf265]
MQKTLRRLVAAPPPPAPDFSEVEVFSWSPASGHRNFGDHLARVVVTKMLADRGHVIEEAVLRPRRLMAIGSVIHFARTGDVVWGSGVNGKEMDPSAHRYSQLDVRAVRGPLTREFLQARGINVPEVYGDPALLLPLLFPGRFVPTAQRSHVVVPNLHDMQILRDQGVADLVSPLESWNRCVARILEAELVVASSLHGLIIAEAYGIPARYVRLSDTEKLFKYDDYMRGTGRGGVEAASSIAQALEMGGQSAPVFDAQALLDAFPIDLWRGGDRVGDPAA